MFQTGVFCWAGETSSHWVAVWKKCVECVASRPQILPASSVCAWLPWNPRDLLSSCQVYWVHTKKLLNTLTIFFFFFYVYFLPGLHYSTSKVVLMFLCVCLCMHVCVCPCTSVFDLQTLHCEDILASPQNFNKLSVKHLVLGFMWELGLG